MDDNEEESGASASNEPLDLLNAHKIHRDEHRKHVIQYRAGNLHTFRDGRETPSEEAALEHEKEAAGLELKIATLEASLSGIISKP